MDITEKLAARMTIARERDEMARRYLDQGGIILTRQEAEELLALITGLAEDAARKKGDG